MAIVDANYILRYLLNDHEEHFRKATEVIEYEDVRLLNEVVAEVVYVLQKVYGVKRESISEGVMMVIKYSNVSCDNELVFEKAFEQYVAKNLDFVDCLLFAYNSVEGTEVYTFDKKLNRLMNSQD